MEVDTRTDFGTLEPISRGVSQARKVEFRLFGGLAISFRGEPIRLRNRKAQALLGYLLLHPTASETRERLAGLLWSESEEDKARASLRQTLRELREEFEGRGIGIFATPRSEVLLAKADIGTDVGELLTCLDHGLPHQMLVDSPQLPETLLAGLDDIDPSFRIWMIIQRQSLQEKLIRGLEGIAFSGSTGPDIGRRAAESIRNMDPTHEEAAQHLMRSAAERGDVASALKIYKSLWDLLEIEYDMEPSAKTQELVVQIKKGEISSGDSFASPVGEGYILVRSKHDGSLLETNKGPNPVITVERFVGAGVPAGKEHLVEGFRHDLIARLVRFRTWSILDDASSLPGELPGGQRYLIRTKVYESGDALHLTLTLQEGRGGVYIWSDSYRLTIASWFEAQQRLVRQISVALNVHLSAQRLSDVGSKHDLPIDMFSRWLIGQNLLTKWRPEDERRAADIFRSIIREAPDFGPAYSSLVQIVNSRHLIFPGIFRTPESTREALELARTAAELDPLDSRTQLCMAWSNALAGSFDAAEFSFSLAMDLNENDPWTLLSSAQGMAFCGRSDLARKYSLQAFELGLIASRLHWGYQVGTRFLCEDYAGCIDAAGLANDAIFNLPGWRSAALALLDRTAEARRCALGFLELVRANWHGETPASDEAIVLWFLHCFPIRDRSAWARLREGLLRAGLPVPEEAS